MGTSAFDLSTLKPVSTPPSGGASAFDLSTLKPVQTTPTQTPQRTAAPAPPAAPSFGQRLSAGWQGLESGGLKGAETGFETGNAPVAPQSKPAQPVSGAALKAPAPPAPRPTTPYRPQATVSAAPTASLWDRARESVANSAVGAAVQSTMPKVAQALGLEPTESEASPTYQQNRQSMPQLPAWTQKPILPAIERGVTAINRAADPRSYTAAGRAVRAQEETQRAQQNAAYDAAHPYQAAVAQAGREFAEGMTTPSNLAQLALVPAAKPLMALYALQGANGTYDSIEQAWEAHKAGKNPEAVKLAAEAGLSGIVTAMAGRAALKGAFPVDTARPTVRDPLVEIPTERPMLTAGTPTTIEGTVPRNGGDGGGPRGRGGAGGGDETVPRNVPRGTVEQPLLTAGETKPILHDETASAADLTESAQKLKPILGDAVLAATKGVPGANLEAVRAKDLDRTVDKTDRQNVQPSQIGDISGAKVTVPDQQAADQVLQNLNRQMPVESVNGQVTGEPGKNGVRQVQATVRLPETGEPVKRAEVLIQTPEMNRAADQTHDDYRRAQELRQAGKDAEAQKLEDKIMRQHDEAERAAQQRLEASNAVPERGPAGMVQRPPQEAGFAGGERGRVEPIQQGQEVAAQGAQATGEKGQIEPRYKFGNTQANIPESSPASQALNRFRDQIPENHLAGDGRDVGAGGNHVTVRYGVKGEDTDEIQHYIEGQRPFTVRLGQTDVFPPTENSNGAAVVHAKIEAPELARINSEIEKHGDFEPSSFKDYKPHATIAYIDPAQAEAYRGRKDLAGKEFPVNSITISDRNGNQREVQLLGAGGAEQTQLGNRPAVGGHDGKPTELIVSPTNKMPAIYRLVEASDLVPSHNAQSFEPNPAYPTGVQERDYKGSKAAQTRVIEQAQNYDPAYTVNTNPDAVNGPPVITPDGTVLGGNSRVMSTQRVYAAGQGETYRDALKRDANSYGLTADQVDAMKQPVLVRQVERPGSLDEARRLGSALNKSATGALGVSERAVSAGKNLKPETLSTVSNMLAEDDSSMRELLGRRGPEILRMIEQDGAITDRERPQFLDAQGGLSEEGKTFVERAMLGSVVNDSHLMDVAPKAILGKLEKSLGSIASIGSRPDEWNLLPVLRPALLRAVAEHASIAQRGSTVELTVNQRDMFGPGRNPLVDALVRVLDEKPNAVRAKFEAFAKDANQNLPDEARIFGGGQAFDAFNNAFGSKLSDEEFRNGIDELLNLKGSTAAAKRQETPTARPNAVVPQRAAGKSTLRAPAPPTGRTAAEPNSGGGSPRAARPTDLAPRAPAPPAATKSPFMEGRQKTAIELRTADGNWQPATLDYYNGGVNGQPRRGRVTLANGSKLNDVPESGMRLATKEAPAPANAPGSSDETVHPIGPPIEGDIANLVRDRISKGLPVKIFTRRISREPREANRRAVDAAIHEQFGVSLPITDVKTAGDGAIYDDSSNVEHNTGRILSHTTNPGDEGKPILVDLDGTLRKSIPSGVTSPGVPPGGEAITERGIEGGQGTSTAGQPNGAVPTEVGRQPQRGGAVEPVATREAEPAPTRAAEEPRDAEAVRREPAAADPEWSGTRGAHMQERLLAKGKFDRELSRAKASTEPENIVRAQANPIQLHGVQVAQLNADAFQFLSERLSPGVDWPGVFLDRRSASKWVAEIGARASKLRQEGMGAAADAAKKLQLALDGIREPDGSIVLLREDYNDSTIREELAHRWQTKTDLRGSYAQTEVSQRPEFEEVNQRLRDIGYDLSPEDQATELIAKALAGDPAMKWTPEQQNAVVSAALHAAIDEMGSGVLDDMAPYDPAVKTSVEEAKQYGKESNARTGGEAVRGVVETPDEGLSQVGRKQGSDLSEEPRNRPAGPGGQRGISEGRAAEGELGTFQRAPKPPASRALPGMERDIEAQRDAAAEEQGRQLTERLRAPRPLISRAAGIMERESPLFRDTDAGGQGSLFQRAIKDEETKTQNPWFLKSAKVIDSKMRGPMPGDALLHMLENNGVKPDEIKWSGLEDLRGEKRVTPDEVKESLAANAISLEEVEKGDSTNFKQIDSYKGEPVYTSEVRGGKAFVSHNPGFPWRVDLPNGESTGGFNSAEDAMKSIGQNLRYQVNPARHTPYVLPGGENYHELLLKLPDVERIPLGNPSFRQASFHGPHWDEPNVLGHIRFNDRTGPNGEKLLHVEELQSDWHQKGRTEGYKAGLDATRTRLEQEGWEVGPVDSTKWNPITQKHEEVRLGWRAELISGTQKGPLAADKESAWKAVSIERDRGIPDAPFKKTWPELLLKRMIRYASENGYDGISWTPGKRQAERYNLSKQVSEVTYKGNDRLIVRGTNGSVIHNDIVPPEKLPDVIGKEAAQKLLAMEPTHGSDDGSIGDKSRRLYPEDLKVGGEGMKGFYDKIVPDLANKIGKQFGAKVGSTEIQVAAEKGAEAAHIVPATLGGFKVADAADHTLAGPFDTRAEAEDEVDRMKKSGSLAVQYLPVTDEMRGRVMSEGQPLFTKSAKGPGRADEDDAARMAREGLPLKEERPKPRETTATTGNHDIDKGIDETIDELGKLPKRKMSASEHMDQAVDAATKGVTEKTEAVKGAFAGVKGAAAGAWSTWCTPPAWSDYRQSLSDLRSAEFKAARQVDVYQKTLVKVAPSERERNAITIYGEAESAAQLKHWQMAARAIPNIPKEAVRAFDDALKLTPEQKSVAEAHRDYYSQQLKILTDAGLLPTGASNYTMHMFASDPETLSRLNSVTNLNELSPNPSFLNKRVYPSFFEAIKNGEKPTTLDAGKILSAYHDAFTKTFMTRSFIRSLIYGNAKDGRPLAILESRAGTTVLDKKGTSGARILKQPKRPEDMSDYVRDPAGQMKNFTWELTDEDREMLAPGYSQMPKDEQSKLFGPDDPRFPVPAGKVLALRGDILLHPEVAKQVHDLVTKSWFKTKPGKTWGAMTGPERVEEGARLGLNAIGTAGATAKGVILYGSGFHQVQLSVHSMEHLVNPFRLPSMDEQANNPIVLEGVAHGLNLLNIDTTGVLSTLPGMGTYHRYLFRDYIPRLKAEMYKQAFARNMERFGGAKDGKAATMTRDEIHLLTAQQANAAFGGLDPAFFEQLNRMNNKTYQAIEHLLLFSPDFTKARIQFAAQGIGEIPRLAARVTSKPFKSTQAPPPLHTEQLAALLRGALVMYGICRITNAVINRDQGAKGAHWDWQDALVVVTPKSWGVLGDKHIGLRMVQGDMLELIKNPVTWAYNRLNPATLRPAIEFLTGRDNFGRQESKMNFAKNYLKQMAPIQVQQLFTTSDEGWIDSLFTSAGLQLGNYRSPLEQEAHKLRLSDIPDRPGTEEKMDEARANIQEVKKLRDAGAIGENPSAWPEPAQKMVDDIRDKVANGKMSSRAASTIILRAGMTEFQYDVLHLSMDDAMSIWNKAGAGERAELKDVITEKASRSLEATAKDKGIDATNELEARLKDKGITVGPQ